MKIKLSFIPAAAAVISLLASLSQSSVSSTRHFVSFLPHLVFRLTRRVILFSFLFFRISIHNMLIFRLNLLVKIVITLLCK